MGRAADRDVDVSLVPQHDEVSAVARVPVDDTRTGADAPVMARPLDVLPNEPADRVRPRAAVLFRPALFSRAPRDPGVVARKIRHERDELHVPARAFNGRTGEGIPARLRL